MFRLSFTRKMSIHGYYLHWVLLVWHTTTFQFNIEIYRWKDTRKYERLIDWLIDWLIDVRKYGSEHIHWIKSKRQRLGVNERKMSFLLTLVGTKPQIRGWGVNTVYKFAINRKQHSHNALIKCYVIRKINKQNLST